MIIYRYTDTNGGELIGMTDFYERLPKIGKRIRNERKEAGMNQEELASAIAFEIGRDGCSQNTVSDWENGKALPTMKTLLAMSKIFGCDCGYLLCDYDEKTHDQQYISKETGLSPEAVQYLCFQRHWGIGNHLAEVLNALIYEDKYFKGHFSRSILSYLWFFFRFQINNSERKQILINGEIVEDKNTKGGYIDSATTITSEVMENAILLEIVNSLRRVKNELFREDNYGKHTGKT